MLCFEVKTSTMSADCTPTWKPKLPPVRLMKIGLLQPPLSLRTTSTRRVATLSVGYADGYRRALGNGATALLNGASVPVIGLVTMDMTMVDVTDVGCAVGDVVTLVGRDGDRLLRVADVARSGGLSPYELLTGLRSRVERRYAGGDA